jgi:pectate lyase
MLPGGASGAGVTSPSAGTGSGVGGSSPGAAGSVAQPSAGTSAGGTSSAGAPSGGTTSGGAPGGGAPAGGAANGGSAMGGTATAGAAGTGGMAPSTADGTGAPQTTPQGYGKGTTGGGSASPKKVDSLAALQSAIDAYGGSGGLVLEYTGKFDFKSITDPCGQHTKDAQILEIKSKNDISILGAEGSAANFGIHIAAASSNIIVRNMTIGLTPGGDASDIISIEGMSGGTPSKIWIDHNEMFTSMATCAGAGDTAFDGMLDIKKGADNITVSYNYMHDHAKVTLNGFSDSDDQVRHVTFHHNLFERVGSRVPLQRNGFSHVVNNYLLNVSTSGINVRMGGKSLVEANYFEKVANPVTARDSDAVGFWDLRNNNLKSAADVAPGNAFGITWTAGNSGTVNATDWETTAAYPALGYEFTAQPFQCIHDGLRAAAGAGKGLATLKCK